MFGLAVAGAALLAWPTVAGHMGGRAALVAQVVPPAGESAGDSLAAEARQDTLPGLLLAHNLGGGGRLLVYREPESALVALRFSFPLLAEYGPVRAYARMAQWLARPELERRAAVYGARVELECSYDHASFAITGPARDAADLARILRQALGWGGWSERDIRTARFAEGSRQQERTETPGPLLEDRLAVKLIPALPAADSAPRRVTAAMLRAFWESTFQPERLQAVVVGRVTDADALALMSGWPAANVARVQAEAPDREEGAPAETAADSAAAPAEPAAARAAPPTVPAGPAEAAQRKPRQPAPSRPGVRRERGRGAAAPARAPAQPVPAQQPTSSVGQPQVLYPWAALGWATRADAAAAAVAARLVAAHLTGHQLRLARAELWWSERGRALVVIGSATAPDSVAVPGAPRPPTPATPSPSQSLAAAVAATRADLSREQIQAAALAISREILLSTRTPDGLARFLGEMFERTDRPTGGQTFLRQLGRVDPRAVERALSAEGEPVQAELKR